KNHRSVAVVTSPAQYEKVLGDLRQHKGSTCGKHRLKLAQKAFAHTAAYDAKIAEYLDTKVLKEAPGAIEAAAEPSDLPTSLSLRLQRKQILRYGENPAQRAALYVEQKPKRSSVAFAVQHHGKELSYINLLDADAALACAKEYSRPAACVVKHAT